MKVEILEETGIREAGILYPHGDQVTMPNEVGERWCAAGWAKDLDGNVETGERRTDLNVRLDVDNIVVEHDAGDVG